MTDPPPAARRDSESPAAGRNGPRCDCGGCREAAAIYAEPRREPTYGDRLAKRTEDRAEQRRLEEDEAERDAAVRAAG